MKNNKARLAFEMLEREMEVLTLLEQFAVKGGTGNESITWSPSGWITDALSHFFGTTVTSGIDGNSNWVIKIGNSNAIHLTFSLGEITINSSGGLKTNTDQNLTNWTDIFEVPPYNSTPSDPYNPESNPDDIYNSAGYYANLTSFGTINFESYYTAYDSEYDLNGYNSMGYNSMGYDFSNYNSMGYNSMGYNSMGYNVGGINSTAVNNVNLMVGLTATSVISQFQPLLSNTWVGQNGVTTFTGVVTTINSSPLGPLGVTMDLTIDDGATSSISLTMGSFSVTYLAEVGYTLSKTNNGITTSVGMSLGRSMLFCNSITTDSVIYGEEYNHIPGWGDVIGVLAIMGAVESGGVSLEAYAELGTLFAL